MLFCKFQKFFVNVKDLGTTRMHPSDKEVFLASDVDVMVRPEMLSELEKLLLEENSCLRKAYIANKKSYLDDWFQADRIHEEIENVIKNREIKSLKKQGVN